MTKAKDLLKHAGKVKDKSFYSSMKTANITFNMRLSEHKEIMEQLNHINLMIYDLWTVSKETQRIQDKFKENVVDK